MADLSGEPDFHFCGRGATNIPTAQSIMSWPKPFKKRKYVGILSLVALLPAGYRACRTLSHSDAGGQCT